MLFTRNFSTIFFIFLTVLVVSLGCHFIAGLTGGDDGNDLEGGQGGEIIPDTGMDHKLSLQGQIGGSSYAVAVQGDYAYLGVGPRLYVLETSDLSAPKFMGQSGAMPGVVQSMVASGSYVYVAAGKGYLRVIDVSDPTKPTEVASYVEYSHAQGLALDQNTLYVADKSFGMRVVDVSDPLKPRKIGEVNIAGAAMSVDLDGSRAFLAGSTTENGIVVIDITNPARPVQTASIAIPESEGSVVYAVKVKENYAYVAIGSSGLVVVDISDPARPIRAGGFFTGWADGLVVEGNLLYLADQLEGLYALDISDPKHPTQMGLLFLDLFQQEVPAQRGMAVQNGKIFLANGNQGMLEVDAAGQLTLTGRFNSPLPGADRGVVVDRNIAYVIADSLGLYSIDVSDPFQPQQLNFDISGVIGSRTPRGIAVSGPYAYVADINNGFSIYDISIPSGLKELSRVEKPQGMTDVAVSGTYAYVTLQEHKTRENQETRGMLVYDVSNPVQPKLVRFMNTDHSLWAVAAQRGYVYLPEVIEMVETGQPSNLFVFDISNPSNPGEVGRAETALNASMVLCIKVSGSYAYVGDQTRGLRIFDISDPADPVEVGSLPDIMMVFDLAVVGDKVFTADHGFVSVVDVSNPANPILEDMYISSGLSWGVDVVGNTVYVADYDGGLAVLHYEE
jgi:hypothetical protein